MGPGTATPRIYEFRIALESGRVDKTNGIIRGVALITKGEARGHDLEVDDETLKQIFSCARTMGKVPVKANHKSGVGDVTGYLENFSLDGDKVRGDWYLLNSYPQRAQFLETAERMPTGVGLSVSFVGPDEPVMGFDGRAKARCNELLAVDYVTMPAANPNGLFERRVDTGKPGMSDPASPSAGNAPASLESVAAAIAQLTQRLDQRDQQFAEFQQEVRLGIDKPSLEDVLEMTDEQRARYGITDEDVEASIAAIEAQGAAQLDENGNPINPEGAQPGDQPGAKPGEGAQPGAQPGAAAPAAGAGAAAATAAAATALARIEKKVTSLEAKFTQAEREEFMATLAKEFDSVEEHITSLEAEVTVLREANKRGGAPVSRALGTGNIVEFQRNGADPKNKFENRVTELMRDEKKSKVVAFTTARKEDPAAYEAYLARRGIIKA